MADYDSSLPIRSEGDADDKVQSKIVDFTTPAQGLAVDTDGNAQAKVHGTDPAAADQVLRLSELGAVNPDGVYHASDNTKPGHTGIIAHDRNASPSDATLTKRVTAKTGTTDTTVTALDVAIRDASGNAFSAGNPLPVSVAVGSAGDPVLDFKQASAVAKDASDTHTYTPASGQLLNLQKIAASGSGKIKVEIKIGTTSAEVLKVVLFNSTANPNVEYEFAKPQDVADTESVLVVITNLDNQAQNLYSTIEGSETTP